ncbi:MAG: transcription-repair coupling factor [Chloroflexi bacterium]|nr:transcription-repair coupling factor [Chloroflexota bacterium]
MQLTGLLDVLAGTEAFQSLVNALNTHLQEYPDQMLVRAARPYVVAALARELARPVLVVTARVERAYDIAEQLPAWLPDTRILRFQEPTAMFYERAPWTEVVMRARLQTLAALAPPIVPGNKTPSETQPPILVTSAYALMQVTVPVRDFRAASRQFRVGQRIDIDQLIKQWVGVGYQPVSVVVQPGTFSRRGGIVDVFPPAMDFPVRIEFFGDEIDSLRTFDPATQRSVEPLKNFVTTPAREALPGQLPVAAARLAQWFEGLPPQDEDLASPAPDWHQLENATGFPMAESYLPYLYDSPASLLDYLPDDTLIIVEDWANLRDTIGELEDQALGLRDEKEGMNALPPNAPLPYHTWDEILDQLSARAVLHLGQPDDIGQMTSAVLGEFFSPGPRYAGQLRLFLDELQQSSSSSQSDNPTHADTFSIIVTRQAQRVAELWGERTDHLTPVTKLESASELRPITFVEGALTEGWTLHYGDTSSLYLLTDAEIFGWNRPEPRRRIQPRPMTPEAYFADMTEGDYVVHVDYGVGKFKGIHKRKLDGSEREYLLVEYGGGDMLYVPIHQADRLSKYVGSDGGAPTVNRLGSQEWGRTKERTQKAVEEVAEDLLQLYAARNVVRGHAFNPDSAWQHEMEASFPYVETDDQLRAIDEVKADMERPRPMDRLICGDVGYGKTEVALRAAFKAVMDGKQVALLVPTTVLAQQHYTTFGNRVISFPMRVEMLSRFRTRPQQDAILQDLKEGKIDIIIGTHRLLQEDVGFKDLGLLIIDEEQRFGVTHKEQLKKMRTEVDVLTMTATPIPRTLYMGLTGVRDISVIQTPPDERLPVVTHVGVYDDKLVRQAILRELDRGGQVFFVHNRVQSIDMMADRLRRLVPEASFVIGHGQMEERELEAIMGDFAAGEYDVLVSTTIIESGLDIPNANTIIIDRADRFGLAQLYQLRGRVGRSANQAFVYFFHDRDHRMTPEARERLETIGEYTDLGAGLSIAIRDLEIRGIGDLLGTRQSGHIDAVGFHLYTQMLSDAVQRVRQDTGGETLTVEEVADHAADQAAQLLQARSMVTIDLALPGYLPVDYVPDMQLRIQLYRRLANVETEAEVDAMQAELQDRFGVMPKSVEGLLVQLRIKLLAQQAGATAVATENGRLNIKLPYLGSIDRVALQNYLGEVVRVSRTAIWFPQNMPELEWRPLLVDILRRLDREQVQEVFAIGED